MAADFAAILLAVEELCVGTIGAVRVVSAGALALGAYETQTEEAAAAGALVNSRVEVEYTGHGRTGASGPVNASIAILKVDLEIRFLFSTEFELQEAERRGTRAQCASLIDDVRGALQWPGNLAATSGGAVTGLVTKCLHTLDAVKVDKKDFPGRLYAAKFGAHGLVQAAQLVS